jgi:hypothetical protein
MGESSRCAPGDPEMAPQRIGATDRAIPLRDPKAEL